MAVPFDIRFLMIKTSHMIPLNRSEKNNGKLNEDPCYVVKISVIKKFHIKNQTYTRTFDNTAGIIQCETMLGAFGDGMYVLRNMFCNVVFVQCVAGFLTRAPYSKQAS